MLASVLFPIRLYSSCTNINDSNALCFYINFSLLNILILNEKLMTNSSGDTLYSVYGNAGFSWPLVVSAISFNIPGILGLVLNSALIWVTYRSKSLNGTANYLLALCSFFELLHQNGHLLFLYMTLSGRNFLPYGLAVRICAVSLFGTGGIPTSMAFTGLDRLLAIIFPTFHKSMKTKLYLGSITLISCLLGALQLYAFITNDVDPSMEITGALGDFLNWGSARFVIVKTAFLLYNITILCYILIGIILKLKLVPSTTNDAVTRRVFRSLFIIIILNVGGYYIVFFYGIFIAPNVTSQVTVWFSRQTLGILLNFGAAVNAPILYFTSKEYRKAFQQEFPWLAKCCLIKPIITPHVPNGIIGPSLVRQMQTINVHSKLYYCHSKPKSIPQQ